MRVRIPDSVPVDVPGAASSSAKLLLKLRVKRLPVSRDTGVADEAFFGISFGHTLRRRAAAFLLCPLMREIRAFRYFWPPSAMSQKVKGFGCRPVVTYLRALRAGVRKPPRKEPAGAG